AFRRIFARAFTRFWRRAESRSSRARRSLLSSPDGSRLQTMARSRQTRFCGPRKRRQRAGWQRRDCRSIHAAFSWWARRCGWPGEEDVWAAGDTIAFAERELPKSGVYAVRAGPALADNIRRTLTGKTLRPFKPQREALYLVSTGGRYAVGSRNGVVVEGAWVWHWKDWIDRRFMRKYNELPEMKPAPPALPPLADREALKEISAIAMRCGGCGAKVGATVLAQALAGVAPVARPDVVVGLDAPDDAALVDVGGEKLSLQTVDYFRAIVDDPYTLG